MEMKNNSQHRCCCGVPILYYDELSPQARSCHMLIKVLDIDVELRCSSESHSQANYSGMVPTLVDGKLTLNDGHTIMMYLCDKYACVYLPHLCPCEYLARLKLLNMLFYEAAVLYQRLSHMLTEILLEKYPNVDMDYHQGKVVDSYNALNSFLEGHTFMVGNCLTIADFSMITTVGSLDLMFPIYKDHWPNLHRWFENLKNMECYKYNQEGIDRQRHLLETVGEFPFTSSSIYKETAAYVRSSIETSVKIDNNQLNSMTEGNDDCLPWTESSSLTEITNKRKEGNVGVLKSSDNYMNEINNPEKSEPPKETNKTNANNKTSTFPSIRRTSIPKRATRPTFVKFGQHKKSTSSLGTTDQSSPKSKPELKKLYVKPIDHQSIPDSEEQDISDHLKKMDCSCCKKSSILKKSAVERKRNIIDQEEIKDQRMQQTNRIKEHNDSCNNDDCQKHSINQTRDNNHKCVEFECVFDTKGIKCCTLENKQYSDQNVQCSCCSAPMQRETFADDSKCGPYEEGKLREFKSCLCIENDNDCDPICPCSQRKNGTVGQIYTEAKRPASQEQEIDCKCVEEDSDDVDDTGSLVGDDNCSTKNEDDTSWSSDDDIDKSSCFCDQVHSEEEDDSIYDCDEEQRNGSDKSDESFCCCDNETDNITKIDRCLDSSTSSITICLCDGVQGNPITICYKDNITDNKDHSEDSIASDGHDSTEANVANTYCEDCRFSDHQIKVGKDNENLDVESCICSDSLLGEGEDCQSTELEEKNESDDTLNCDSEVVYEDAETYDSRCCNDDNGGLLICHCDIIDKSCVICNCPPYGKGNGCRNMSRKFSISSADSIEGQNDNLHSASKQRKCSCDINPEHGVDVDNVPCGTARTSSSTSNRHRQESRIGQFWRSGSKPDQMEEEAKKADSNLQCSCEESDSYILNIKPKLKPGNGVGESDRSCKCSRDPTKASCSSNEVHLQSKKGPTKLMCPSDEKDSGKCITARTTCKSNKSSKGREYQNKSNKCTCSQEQVNMTCWEIPQPRIEEGANYNCSSLDATMPTHARSRIISDLGAKQSKSNKESETLPATSKPSGRYDNEIGARKTKQKQSEDLDTAKTYLVTETKAPKSPSLSATTKQSSKNRNDIEMATVRGLSGEEQYEDPNGDRIFLVTETKTPKSSYVAATTKESSKNRRDMEWANEGGHPKEKQSEDIDPKISSKSPAISASPGNQRSAVKGHSKEKQHEYPNGAKICLSTETKAPKSTSLPATSKASSKNRKAIGRANVREVSKPEASLRDKASVMENNGPAKPETSLGKQKNKSKEEVENTESNTQIEPLKVAAGNINGTEKSTGRVNSQPEASLRQPITAGGKSGIQQLKPFLGRQQEKPKEEREVSSPPQLSVTRGHDKTADKDTKLGVITKTVERNPILLDRKGYVSEAKYNKTIVGKTEKLDTEQATVDVNRSERVSQPTSAKKGSNVATEEANQGYKASNISKPEGSIRKSDPRHQPTDKVRKRCEAETRNSLTNPLLNGCTNKVEACKCLDNQTAHNNNSNPVPHKMSCHISEFKLDIDCGPCADQNREFKNEEQKPCPDNPTAQTTKCTTSKVIVTSKKITCSTSTKKNPVCSQKQVDAKTKRLRAGSTDRKHETAEHRCSENEDSFLEGKIPKLLNLLLRKENETEIRKEQFTGLDSQDSISNCSDEEITCITNICDWDGLENYLEKPGNRGRHKNSKIPRLCLPKVYQVYRESHNIVDPSQTLNEFKKHPVQQVSNKINYSREGKYHAKRDYKCTTECTRELREKCCGPRSSYIPRAGHESKMRRNPDAQKRDKSQSRIPRWSYELLTCNSKTIVDQGSLICTLCHRYLSKSDSNILENQANGELQNNHPNDDYFGRSSPKSAKVKEIISVAKVTCGSSRDCLVKTVSRLITTTTKLQCSSDTHRNENSLNSFSSQSDSQCTCPHYSVERQSKNALHRGEEMLKGNFMTSEVGQFECCLCRGEQNRLGQPKFVGSLGYSMDRTDSKKVGDKHLCHERMSLSVAGVERETKKEKKNQKEERVDGTSFKNATSYRGKDTISLTQQRSSMDNDDDQQKVRSCKTKECYCYPSSHRDSPQNPITVTLKENEGGHGRIRGDLTNRRGRQIKSETKLREYRDCTCQKSNGYQEDLVNPKERLSSNGSSTLSESRLPKLINGFCCKSTPASASNKQLSEQERQTGPLELKVIITKCNCGRESTKCKCYREKETILSEKSKSICACKNGADYIKDTTNEVNNKSKMDNKENKFKRENTSFRRDRETRSKVQTNKKETDERENHVTSLPTNQNEDMRSKDHTSTKEVLMKINRATPKNENRELKSNMRKVNEMQGRQANTKSSNKSPVTKYNSNRCPASMNNESSTKNDESRSMRMVESERKSPKKGNETTEIKKGLMKIKQEFYKKEEEPSKDEIANRKQPKATEKCIEEGIQIKSEDYRSGSGKEEMPACADDSLKCQVFKCTCGRTIPCPYRRNRNQLEIVEENSQRILCGQTTKCPYKDGESNIKQIADDDGGEVNVPGMNITRLQQPESPTKKHGKPSTKTVKGPSEQIEGNSDMIAKSNVRVPTNQQMLNKPKSTKEYLDTKPNQKYKPQNEKIKSSSIIKENTPVNDSKEHMEANSDIIAESSVRIPTKQQVVNTRKSRKEYLDRKPNQKSKPQTENIKTSPTIKENAQQITKISTSPTARVGVKSSLSVKNSKSGTGTTPEKLSKGSTVADKLKSTRTLSSELIKRSPKPETKKKPISVTAEPDKVPQNKKSKNMQNSEHTSTSEELLDNLCDMSEDSFIKDFNPEVTDIPGSCDVMVVTKRTHCFKRNGAEKIEEKRLIITNPSATGLRGCSELLLPQPNSEIIKRFKRIGDKVCEITITKGCKTKGKSGDCEEN